MKKTLYFEGAGLDFYESCPSDVGNYRIRTAFKNLNGDSIYIELGRSSRFCQVGKNGKTLKKPKLVSEWALHIDYVFEIVPGEKDNCNNSRINYDWQHIKDNYDYTKSDITRWINENLNCDFDTIEVLDWLSGYRVHGKGQEKYNLMDDFPVNHELTTRRKAAYETIDQEYRKALHETYSKIGLLEMDDTTITIRCYASDLAMSKTDLPRTRQISI